MADISAMLTRKVAGIPVWGLGLAGGAGLVGILYLKGKGSNSSASNPMAGASTPAASSASGQLNYPPTVVVTPGGAAASVTSPASATGAPTNAVTVGPVGGQPTAGPPYDTQVAAFTNPDGSGSSILVPFGTYPTAGSPSSNAFGNLGGLQPISYQGGTVYVLGENVQGSTGAGGLGGAVRRNDSVRYFSPFQAPQSVNTAGRGGLGGLSSATGLSLERLKSLNPQLLGKGGPGQSRQSYGEGLTRVA